MTAVLIADSSQTVRMDLGDTFEAAGFRVFSCASVSQARTTLRSQPIALAVIDPAISNGDGHGLIAQIRAEHVLCELPVLALTRSIDVPDVECVGKPYDRAHVIARARELIGTPPLRDSILTRWPLSLRCCCGGLRDCSGRGCDQRGARWRHSDDRLPAGARCAAIRR